MKLSRPRTQTAEVLYELLHGPKTRREFFLNTGILNVTARIAELRNRGLVIECRNVTVKNKHGRQVHYGEWSIAQCERPFAISVYERINGKGE